MYVKQIPRPPQSGMCPLALLARLLLLLGLLGRPPQLLDGCGEALALYIQHEQPVACEKGGCEQNTLAGLL